MKSISDCSATKIRSSAYMYVEILFIKTYQIHCFSKPKKTFKIMEENMKGKGKKIYLFLCWICFNIYITNCSRYILGKFILPFISAQLKDQVNLINDCFVYLLIRPSGILTWTISSSGVILRPNSYSSGVRKGNSSLVPHIVFMSYSTVTDESKRGKHKEINILVKSVYINYTLKKDMVLMILLSKISLV